MKWKLWILTLSSSALLAGCGTPIGDFCDIGRPMYFDRPAVVDWLAGNDEILLRRIIAHNETVDKCP